MRGTEWGGCEEGRALGEGKESVGGGEREGVGGGGEEGGRRERKRQIDRETTRGTWGILV